MLKVWILILSVMLCLFGGCLPSDGENSVASTVADTRRQDTGEKITRVLILGKDRAAGLTDSILIATVNESDNSLRILQIPRDTYAEYTDRDYKKLNGAYSVLGLKGTKDFLSDALGVPLDYALTLDLDCVAELVDAVGGVEVEVTQTMQYRDPYQDLTIDLKPGVHRLDGTAAEQFLRFRSGYVNADLGRMDAQKRFIGAFIKQCSDLNSTSLMQLVWKLFPHVETDLPVHRAVQLAKALPKCNVENIPMLTAPGEAVRGVSGAWYFCVNRQGMIDAVRTYLLTASDFADEDFDPNRRFDREENPDFHNIYIAPYRGDES